MCVSVESILLIDYCLESLITSKLLSYLGRSRLILAVSLGRKC